MVLRRNRKAGAAISPRAHQRRMNPVCGRVPPPSPTHPTAMDGYVPRVPVFGKFRWFFSFFRTINFGQVSRVIMHNIHTPWTPQIFSQTTRRRRLHGHSTGPQSIRHHRSRPRSFLSNTEPRRPYIITRSTYRSLSRRKRCTPFVF